LHFQYLNHRPIGGLKMNKKGFVISGTILLLVLGLGVLAFASGMIGFSIAELFDKKIMIVIIVMIGLVVMASKKR